MNNRLQLTLTFGVLASFVVAGLVALYTVTPARAIGALLLGTGLTAIGLARGLKTAQKQLAHTPSIPRYWANVRPLTFALWGSGVALVGILQLTIF
jgi:hypothetical protein